MCATSVWGCLRDLNAHGRRGAFAMGALRLTGTINQSATEAGLSDAGKQMLAEAGLADTIMAPAADMFEQGVRVQVLRKGTMFGVRALRLYELYKSYDSLEAMPQEARSRLEREILGVSCATVWSEVQRYFQAGAPEELQRAERDAKHRMALVFRWYLGLSSRWAIAGDQRRRLDYQVWCGPAMGAFNDWAKGSFLEAVERRTVVQIALNLLEGAAAITRAQQFRSAGMAVPPEAFAFKARPLRVQSGDDRTDSNPGAAVRLPNAGSSGRDMRAASEALVVTRS